jgi:3-methyladenine DNA glycosylase AlkD
MASVELLIARTRSLEAADMQVLETYVRESKTWALVDGLATSVVGPVVERHPMAPRSLDRWARDGDFWVRRASLLALLKPLRAGGASGVTIREAVRYLSPRQRENVLHVYEDGRRKSGASRRKRPRK